MMGQVIRKQANELAKGGFFIADNLCCRKPVFRSPVWEETGTIPSRWQQDPGKDVRVHWYCFLVTFQGVKRKYMNDQWFDYQSYPADHEGFGPGGEDGGGGGGGCGGYGIGCGVVIGLLLLIFMFIG